MEMLTDLLKKRTKIIQIAVWVCAGFSLLGFFLPAYAAFGEKIFLFDALTGNGDSDPFMKVLLLLLMLIVVAIAAAFYNKSSFVVSIVVLVAAVLAKIFHATIFSKMGKSYVRYLDNFKAIGTTLLNIFLVLLILVGVVAVAAEVYVKFFAEKAAAGTTATTTQAKGWFCPQCGAPNEATGKFCNKCGTQKPE